MPQAKDKGSVQGGVLGGWERCVVLETQSTCPVLWWESIWKELGHREGMTSLYWGGTVLRHQQGSSPTPREHHPSRAGPGMETTSSHPSVKLASDHPTPALLANMAGKYESPAVKTNKQTRNSKKWKAKVMELKSCLQGADYPGPFLFLALCPSLIKERPESTIWLFPPSENEAYFWNL